MHHVRARGALENAIDGASSLVSEQAANRLPVARATLHTLISGSHHRANSERAS
jgi:hypothetical protein